MSDVLSALEERFAQLYQLRPSALPVHIVEYYHDVLSYLHKHFCRTSWLKRLSWSSYKRSTTPLHFDVHPGLPFPKLSTPTVCLISDICTTAWIWTHGSCRWYASSVTNILWVRLPWFDCISDSIYNMHIGKSLNGIKIDIYFTAACI